MKWALAAMSVGVLLAGCGGAQSGDAAGSSAAAGTSGGLGPPDSDVGVNKYPLGTGRYLVTADPGWVYFRTPAGKGCAIGPIGQVAACDFAPADAPPGSTQTIIDGDVAALYRRASAPAFTRAVDVLAPGHRLTNGATRCAVGRQGEVRCETEGGAHGFVIDATKGSLW